MWTAWSRCFTTQSDCWEKGPKNVKITLLKLVNSLEMKVRQMIHVKIFFGHFVKNTSVVSPFNHESQDWGSAQCSVLRLTAWWCLRTHQTLVFSSSVTALRVSGKQGWRRKSPSSSTQRTLSPPSPNCPSLSPSSTTVPWTSRRRRSLTSLRRWWWVLCVFAKFAPDTKVPASCKKVVYRAFSRPALQMNKVKCLDHNANKSSHSEMFGHVLPLRLLFEYFASH